MASEHPTPPAAAVCQKVTWLPASFDYIEGGNRSVETESQLLLYART